MSFQAMKIRVESPEHSEKVQHILFVLGYRWRLLADTTPKHTDKSYLYAEADGDISFGHDGDFFNSDNGIEKRLLGSYLVDVDKTDTCAAPSVVPAPLPSRAEWNQTRRIALLQALLAEAIEGTSLNNENILELNELAHPGSG